MAKKAINNRKRIEALCSKYGVTERMVYLAVLIAWGVPEGDAFMTIMDCKPEMREQMWERFKNDKSNVSALAMIRELRDGTAEQGVRVGPEYDLKSKDGMIEALSAQVRDTQDPKQKADILMKIADLQRMKQDENTEKEKLVHYYLPLRCEACPWKR